MLFRLLGPFEVVDGDTVVDIAGGKRRSLLALLLLHRNQVVPADRLIEELWAGRPPPTAAKSLQVHVSHLRKDLATRNGAGAHDLLITRGGGYALRIDDDGVDVHRFEQLLTDGQVALARGDPARARAKLAEALALWRGPALADFSYEAFAQSEIARLEEQRMLALEGRIAADLDLRRHSEVVAELEALVRAHPLREALRGQLMLALYRCGRHAEALEVYRTGRRRLLDELGLEPGPGLKELEQAILVQSPDLAAPARSAESIAPPADQPASGPAPAAAPALHRRRHTAAVAAALSAALLAAATSVAAVRLLGDEPSNVGRAASVPLDLSPNAVAALETSGGNPRVAVPLPGRAADLAVSTGALWAVTANSATLTGVDRRTGKIVRTIPLPGTPDAVAAGFGSLWIADAGRAELTSVKEGYERVSAPVALSQGRESGVGASVATGVGSVWVTDGSPTLTRVDPATRRTTAIAAGRPLRGVAVAAGAVWAISASPPSVLRIDPRASAVTHRVPLARQGDAAPFPAEIAASADAVWVLNRNTASVTRIDPASLGPSAVIRIGAEHVPNEIAASGRAAWVANEDGTLLRIDAATNTPAYRWVGESLREVTTDGERVWVATAALDQQLPGGAG
jgi:DNA-binding SARP family transcriptional activator